MGAVKAVPQKGIGLLQTFDELNEHSVRSVVTMLRMPCPKDWGSWLRKVMPRSRRAVVVASISHTRNARRLSPTCFKAG
jgi:isocitrate dehydrogenase kinase/phosphatase